MNHVIWYEQKFGKNITGNITYYEEPPVFSRFFYQSSQVVLLLLATSPELLPMHLAALDRNLLEDPLILSAVKACADFLSVSACWNISMERFWRGFWLQVYSDLSRGHPKWWWFFFGDPPNPFLYKYWKTSVWTQQHVFFWRHHLELQIWIPTSFFFQIAFLHKKNSGGHYCDFLRFVDECHNLDFYILMDLADLARIRLLWLRARAYPKAIFFL